MYTFAPFDASAAAIALPIPVPPPVTKASCDVGTWAYLGGCGNSYIPVFPFTSNKEPMDRSPSSAMTRYKNYVDLNRDVTTVEVVVFVELQVALIVRVLDFRAGQGLLTYL